MNEHINGYLTVTKSSNIHRWGSHSKQHILWQCHLCFSGHRWQRAQLANFLSGLLSTHWVESQRNLGSRTLLFQATNVRYMVPVCELGRLLYAKGSSTPRAKV